MAIWKTSTNPGQSLCRVRSMSSATPTLCEARSKSAMHEAAGLLRDGYPVEAGLTMNGAGHRLQSPILPADQLSQVKPELRSHHVRCGEVGQVQIRPQIHEPDHPQGDFNLRDCALLHGSPLVIVEHGFHQRGREVVAEIKHAIGFVRRVVAVGRTPAKVKRR